MSGNYPPGVTQRDIDEAAGGYEYQRCTLCGFVGPCTRETCPNERAEEDEEE